MKNNFFLNRDFLAKSLFWLLYFSAFVYAERSFYSGYREAILTNSGKFVVMIICYFVLKRVFIPLYKSKKYLYLFLSVALCLYSLSVFNIAWRVFYLQEAFPESYQAEMYEFSPKYVNKIEWMIAFYLIYYFRPSLLIVLYSYIRDQEKIVKYEKEKTGLELKALKNQLSPHFLFNTMNNVYSLSLDNEKKTPELILKLSDILRYIVYNGQEKFVPLESEIEQIQNLIDIESLRHNPEDLSISFVKNIEEKNTHIAPLIILSYVENAFKHGLSDKSGDGKVDIKLFSNHEHITFNILNSIPRKTNLKVQDEFKIGLDNLKKQLKILYNNEYTLSTKQTDLHYEVFLKLKAK